jgi:hypothetical protein
MGRKAQEVLDFNLYLTPNDTWEAVLIQPERPRCPKCGGLLSLPATTGERECLICRHRVRDEQFSGYTQP